MNVSDLSHLDFSFIDVMDFVIVCILLYTVYRLLRHSLGLNIFIGIVLLYLIWWVVGLLEMRLLETILGQFVNLGVLIIIIIFQPEIRRFLIILGETTLKGKQNFLEKYFKREKSGLSSTTEHAILEVTSAIEQLQKEHLGALILFSRDRFDTSKTSQGISIRADVSKELILSIFRPESALHDGSIVIRYDRIDRAGCILPLSKQIGLSAELGFRHRAALGASERTEDLIIVLSEERNDISYAYQGKLYPIVAKQLPQRLKEFYQYGDRTDS